MLKEIKFERAYPSDPSKTLLEEFFIPAFSDSVSYKRSTAFFSGVLLSVITAAARDFFLKNNGEMKLITSPIFDEDHVRSFKNLENFELDGDVNDELNKLLDQLEIDPSKNLALRLLSLLIKENKLEIKICTPVFGGIHHEKVGIFEDSLGNKVSFSGSVNETFFGWTKNNEQMRVFRNWNESEESYLNIDESNFNKLWNNEISNLKTQTLSQSIVDRVLKYSKNDQLEDLISEVKQSFESIRSEAQIPERKNSYELMDHQETVLENWEKSEFKGIVKFATGAGKTFVGLEAINRILKRSSTERTPHALVIAPSILLQEQWIKEIEKYLNYDIVGIGGEYEKKRWMPTLSHLSSPESVKSKVFVSTAASAANQDFLTSFQFGENVVLIFDEVHRAGSSNNSALLNNSFGPRLGLSATPERYSDEIGTEKIYNFFGPVLEPEFSLSDSIQAGRLVPYSYNIFSCVMTQPEQEDYDKLTQNIISLKSLIEEDPNNTELHERLKLLYIKRAKIPKKSENKHNFINEILNEYYVDDSYWIVYCEDNQQLDSVVQELLKYDYNISIYTSSMQTDRKDELSNYESDKGILVAIRCLDEGIDIPYLENAIILASSQNPREFIQRRGRILRSYEGKKDAQLFDILVTPREYNPNNNYGDTLILSELKRAYEFASSAQNKDAKYAIENIAADYGLDLDDLVESYLEEDSIDD